MGRVKAAARNIIFGYIGNLTTQLLGFVLRTIFIRHLGQTLNGVNALYTGILSVLSMAELGIGTALNYSLYKPVIHKDYEKIKSYMLLYKKAYRIIGFVVAGIGLVIVPFLPYLVKQPEGITPRECRAEELYPDEYHYRDQDDYGDATDHCHFDNRQFLCIPADRSDGRAAAEDFCEPVSE